MSYQRPSADVAGIEIAVAGSPTYVSTASASTTVTVTDLGAANTGALVAVVGDAAFLVLPGDGPTLTANNGLPVAANTLFQFFLHSTCKTIQTITASSTANVKIFVRD